MTGKVKPTDTTKKEVEKQKFSLDEIKSKMSQIVRPVYLYTTERIAGQERPVRVNFRHQISKVEAELARGPIELHARGVGAAGLIADLANFYISKENDGYKILQTPEFIRGFRPGFNRETEEKIQIPQFDVTFALEGPYIRTELFEELKN